MLKKLQTQPLIDTEAIKSDAYVWLRCVKQRVVSKQRHFKVGYSAFTKANKVLNKQQRSEIQLTVSSTLNPIKFLQHFG